jgi:hypothetical protein
MINSYHLFRIPAWLSRNLFADPQFRATVAYVISMPVMMPISYGCFVAKQKILSD